MRDEDFPDRESPFTASRSLELGDEPDLSDPLQAFAADLAASFQKKSRWKVAYGLLKFRTRMIKASFMIDPTWRKESIDAAEDKFLQQMSAAIKQRQIILKKRRERPEEPAYAKNPHAPEMYDFCLIGLILNDRS